MADSEFVAATVRVEGSVQGVGFRWWVSSQADELGLAGHAVNLPDGAVEVLAQGPQAAVNDLVQRLQADSSGRGRPGSVSRATTEDTRVDGSLTGFSQG